MPTCSPDQSARQCRFPRRTSVDKSCNSGHRVAIICNSAAEKIADAQHLQRVVVPTPRPRPRESSILFALLLHLDRNRSGLEPPGAAGLYGLKSSSCECSHFCRLLPQHVGPSFCKLYNHVDKLEWRPDRRKLLAEVPSKSHVGLCHFQKLRLISHHVSRR